MQFPPPKQLRKGKGWPSPVYIQEHSSVSKRQRDCRAGRQKQSQKKKAGHLNEGIYKLSTVKLSCKELNILNLGLKCAPKKPLNNTYIDTYKYIRILNMKKYFLNHPAFPVNRVVADPGQVDSGLHNKSIFIPRTIISTILKSLKVWF